VSEVDTVEKTAMRINRPISLVWKYSGALHQSDQTMASEGSILIDGKQLYCKCVSLPFFHDPLIHNLYLEKSTDI